MMTIVIVVAVFFCVAALVGGVAVMFRGESATAVEDRLELLAGNGGAGTQKAGKSDSQLLASGLDDVPSALEELFSKVLNLRIFLEQAGSRMEPTKFLAIVGGLAGIGAMACVALKQIPIALAPPVALVMAALPFAWLFIKRKRRLKAFGKQLPEALELISRALRAGHSLASGFGLVAKEMSEPLGAEFNRCYEEQNLGIPLEEALESMTERVPNLDLRFFATAVILQRQTGGDLAEILDKIGNLVRERFTIWGQIQALTGEGRLSGIVLLALPPLLFLAIFKINRPYVMKLFEDPLGTKMLIVAVIMQVLGALVIRKIVNIKVVAVIHLLAEIDFIMLAPFAGFAAVAAGAWCMMQVMSGRRSRADERLMEIRNGGAQRPQEGDGRGSSTDAVTRMLEKAAPALAKPLTPKTEKDANKLRDKLNHAGFRHENAPTIFLGLKCACFVVGLMMAGGTLAVAGFSFTTLIRTFMIAGGMFYLPDGIVWFLGKRRKQAIFLGLPDALDLMVVCVEAGLGLDQAMRKVAEEMKKSYKVIAYEFGLCNMQMQMGRPRNEVLHELGQRSGVEDLKSLASIIIQADKFGSSIARALRVQSDSMRTRRRQIAEEKAAKTAVKLIFPLVVFIFPGIFVVLVGPAAITMVNKMLPAMQR